MLERLSLRGDETVLDAGCGTGKLTAELLALLPGGRVVAVDLSQNMLEQAEKHLTPAFGGRVTLVAADLQHLPFQYAFDGIFSTAAFHWVLDHDGLFRHLHDALKPGGWLCAQCGGGPNLARLRKRVAALSATPKFARFLRDYKEPWEFANAETAAVRLLRAGFVEVETSVEAAPLVLSDAEDYRQFIVTMVLHRHLERLSQPALREEFLGQLVEQAEADDPPFLMDYWRLNLSGRSQSAGY